MKAGGEGNDRGWDGWMASPTQGTWVWVNNGSWWCTGRPVCCRMWGHKESDMTERLNWTELNWTQALTTWCLLLSSETWPNKYLTWITLIKWSLHSTVRSSLQNMHIFSAAAAKSLSRVWLCATLWIAAHQAPLSTGFSRQEYWSGFPIPSPYLVLLWAIKTL